MIVKTRIWKQANVTNVTKNRGTVTDVTIVTAFFKILRENSGL